MVKLEPGTHIVVLNKVGDQYKAETNLSLQVTELQRYTGVPTPRTYPLKVPNPVTGPQKLFVMVMVCFGCQTCWRMNDKDEIIDTGPHYTLVQDVTEFMRELYTQPPTRFSDLLKDESAVRQHYAAEYALMAEVLDGV